MNIEGKPDLTINYLDQDDYELVPSELDEYIKQWLKEKGIKL
jgi:hypothetical protein